MHKNTKLTPVNRKEIYELWQKGEQIQSLADNFRVTRPIIYKVLKRGRLKDFSVHKSVNERFKKAFYGLKKLSRDEKIIKGKLAKKAFRYEKNFPGEMIHVDTKSIRRLPHEWSKKFKSETLYVAIDDYSRYLIADILPHKDKESSAVFLGTMLEIAPFPVECIYSDNGCEFKGNLEHDFVYGCRKNKIVQKFTRVCRPQTNGKAERVIRTMLTEWLKENKFKTREERRKKLQEYVFYYNTQRPHSALKEGKTPLTPCQILKKFINQKVYTTR